MKQVKTLRYLCAVFSSITLLHAADDTDLCTPFRHPNYEEYQCATRMLLDLIEEPGNMNINKTNIVPLAQVYTQLGHLDVAHRFLSAAQDLGYPEADKKKVEIYLLLAHDLQAQRFYYSNRNDKDVKKMYHEYALWRSTIPVAKPVAWNDVNKVYSQSTGNLPDVPESSSSPHLASSDSPDYLESRAKGLKKKLCRRMSHDADKIKEKTEKTFDDCKRLSHKKSTEIKNTLKSSSSNSRHSLPFD